MFRDRLPTSLSVPNLTLHWRNLKTEISLWRRNKHRSFCIFVRKKNSAWEITWFPYCHCFQEAPFSKCFLYARNRKPAFWRAKSEKLRFRDGLVWDGRPKRRNEAASSNFSGAVWTVPCRPRSCAELNWLLSHNTLCNTLCSMLVS